VLFFINRDCPGDVEFLADLSTYHVTAVCTLNTTVMALRRTHFERLFVKRNADTVTRMRRHVTEQLSARTSRPHLARQLPLFRCVIEQLNQLTTNRLPKTSLGRDDVSVQSGVSTANWRTKSVISSTRSFPLMSVKRSGDQRRGTDASAQHGSNGMFNVRPREATRLRFSHTLDQRPLGRRSAGGRNPRTGIFVKLLAVSNPEQTAWPLHIDNEEYTYLLQLKRRLAKQMGDFFPHMPGTPTRETTRTDQRLPRLGGLAEKQKDSARKPASQSEAGAKRKVTTFVLPGM